MSATHNKLMNSKYPLATFAGVLTWALVFTITLYILQQLSPPQPWLSVTALFLLYGVAFIVLTLDAGLYSITAFGGKLLLVLQLCAAFGLIVILPPHYFDYLAILTIIWVSLLPSVMSTGRAMLVAVLIVIIWFSLLAYLQQRSYWISALLYGSFHLFAVLMQSATQAEKKAKQALADKNQQLLATQQLLQAASRQTERTRIARNLHDVVGHHLTALTIQLQVAGHITEGAAKQQIDKCHQLAKLLLSDVREAVSTLRQYSDVALLDAVQQLTTYLPQQFKVHLEIAPDIMLHDLHQAQHLLCVIQEAMSNSLKHSVATELHIVANLSQQTLQLQISDNGQLPPHWKPGNGIKGMQERIAECGGSMSINTQQQTMQLAISLPYKEGDNA
jgi:two-component system, NarL family, sensor histidine kinase DesK